VVLSLKILSQICFSKSDLFYDCAQPGDLFYCGPVFSSETIGNKEYILMLCLFVLYAQGLIPALQEVMKGAPHRYCIMHLRRNFTKEWKDKELRGAV